MKTERGDCEEIFNFRLGKEGDKQRPLKVRFASKNDVLEVMKRSIKLMVILTYILRMIKVRQKERNFNAWGNIKRNLSKNIEKLARNLLELS